MMDSPTFEPYRVDPAKYRYFFDHQLQASEEDKELLRRALDAWQRATERDCMEPDDLALLVSAATHRRAAVWDSSVALFCSLIGRFPTVKEAARVIMRTGKAAERWHLIQGLHFCSDRSFVHEILEAAIDDKAASVRQRGAAMADRLEMRELVPNYQARLETESDPRTNDAFAFTIAMLTQGYLAKPDQKEPGSVCLSVRMAEGHAFSGQSHVAGLWSKDCIRSVLVNPSRGRWAFSWHGGDAWQPVRRR